MLGQLIAYTINFSMGRPEKPVKPIDFMPSQWEQKKFSSKPKKKRISQKKRKAIVDVFRAWGGGNNGK